MLMLSGKSMEGRPGVILGSLFCSESTGAYVSHLSCHSVDSSSKYGEYCHVSRRATDTPMAFSSFVGFGSCWFCCSLLLLIVSPGLGSWRALPWFLLSLFTRSMVQAHVDSMYSSSHVSPVSLAQWASPQCENICTDFSLSHLTR